MDYEIHTTKPWFQTFWRGKKTGLIEIDNLKISMSWYVENEIEENQQNQCQGIDWTGSMKDGTLSQTTNHRELRCV